MEKLEIERFTDNDNVFAHRQVGLTFQDMIKFKNKVIEAMLNEEFNGFSPLEKRIVKFDKQGKTTKEIAKILDITTNLVYKTRSMANSKIIRLSNIMMSKEGEQ